MPKPSPQTAEAIHLDPADGDRPFVFSTETQDHFLRTCHWAIEACKIGLSRDVLAREFNSLLQYVRAWAEKSSLVAKCFVAPRDDQIAICIVPKSNRFNFDLSDTLTKLDFDLAEKFQQCPCDVIQVPTPAIDDAESRDPLRVIIPVYGFSDGAQQSMVAQP